MSRHVLKLSETNAHNVIPACSCGWLGAIHVPPTTVHNNKKFHDVDRAAAAATREHRAHVASARGSLAR